jgi:glycosyltransferase involved in cell wall biosynthesis
MENKKYKILILYDEIMGYIESGIISFSNKHKNFELHVFEQDFKKITKFQVSPENYYVHYKKSEYNNYQSFLNKCIEISPDLIIVSGRVSSHYLRVAKYFKSKVLTVTIQDTQFDNSLKQRIQILLSSVLYKQYFSGFWGCGLNGAFFAKKLGFERDLIFRNAYSANTNLFVNNIKLFNNKRILFVGRLVEVKNINFLVDSFIKANKLNNNEWELVLVGDGPLNKAINNKEKVSHIPFMNQEQLRNFVSDVDFFCLPSLIEPWGVVVHEFASMGLPLLLSKNVGSSNEFLIEGFNGYSFNPKSSKEFITKLDRMMKLSSSELSELGFNSTRLASRVNTDIWSATLFEISMRSLKIINN